MADGTAIIEMVRLCGASVGIRQQESGDHDNLRRWRADMQCRPLRRKAHSNRPWRQRNQRRRLRRGAAAGIKFYDKSGKSFIPVGRTLKDIASIDYSGIVRRLAAVSISAMCDVDNPLLGETGAANVFGPQKGANVAMIARLDAGLKHLAEVSGKAKLASMPSAGAAGGMGFGMMAFFNCPLQMGIDGLLDIIDFESILAGADLVLTGEGRIDPQSMRGKTVIGVARRASKCGVPTIAVVGDIADGIESAYDLGVSAIFSINRVAMERKLIKLRAKSDMEATVENIIRAVKAVNL